MPLVRRLGGRRITKTRRRGAVIEVRLAADPSAGLTAQWVRVMPEAYGAERTYLYQPLPVRGDFPCS